MIYCKGKQGEVRKVAKLRMWKG